jgi:hypothetical protein
VVFAFSFAVVADLPAGQIGSVSVSRGFFNPTLKESVVLSLAVRSAGTVRAAVLDRDGYVVRTLPAQTPAGPANLTFAWNGRDEEQRVVPDEAYSFKIDFDGPAGRDQYFPATAESSFSTIKADYFDRSTGALAYTLAAPSRVHIQAGSATVDARSGATHGPVLKTLVNRAPRSAGSIVEHWLGFDESGTISVPDLPNFVVSIAATALPENSVITVGNRAETFAAFRDRRNGPSLLIHAAGNHQHHRGLTSDQDVAPDLDITLSGTNWIPGEKTWKSRSAKVLAMKIALHGPNAVNFAMQPGKVMVFLDGATIAEFPTSAVPDAIKIPFSSSGGPDHIVAVNWVTDYGPVAVNSLRVRQGSQRQQEK